MKLANRVWVSLLAALLISGCAGSNFVRPEPGALMLGKSTMADVVQKMGSPLQNAEAIKNDKQLKVAKYGYSEGAGEGARPGVVPARSMAFSFHEDRLVSQEFVSSFKIDSTDFDATKVSLIVKGQTRREDVVGLLGEPTGEAMYPVIRNKDDKAIVYGYVQAKGTAFNMQFHSKTLIVSYDGRGIVTDVEYIASGDR